MQFTQGSMDMDMDIFSRYLEHFMQSPEGMKVFHDMHRRTMQYPLPTNPWPQQPPARPPGGPSPAPFIPGIPGDPPARPPGGPSPAPFTPGIPGGPPSRPPGGPSPMPYPLPKNPWPQQPPSMPYPLPTNPWPQQPPSIPNPGRNPMPGPGFTHHQGRPEGPLGEAADLPGLYGRDYWQQNLPSGSPEQFRNRAGDMLGRLPGLLDMASGANRHAEQDGPFRWGGSMGS